MEKYTFTWFALLFGRLFTHLFVFFVVTVPLMIAGAIILAFVVPLTWSFDKYRLPKLFRWFDSADPYVGRDTSTFDRVCEKGVWAKYTWLAWRNPINYFEYRWLGLQWLGSEFYLRHNPDEDNIGDGTKSGMRYIEVSQNDKRYFEYYLIYQYPFAPQYCLRFRLGWKIKDLNNSLNSISQWCLVFNPFHPWKR